MTYPLLFPRGECSSNAGMEHVEERRTTKRTRVTQLQYYVYRLSQRNGFIILHRSEDIFKHGKFETVLAYIYVIEFQKRGLPHAHILLTLDSESKIRTKDDIDKFMSAELPDPYTDFRLSKIETKCMVHDPCGTININSPCRDGQCCKSFPKQFKNDTEENVNR
ncbi:hypothetical protein AVEN_234818-1 [Araneus ventricosus]|uniref:Helitron helicase-like domain-containing protein n=1 Tax=Araneus ventricosus TaxID=182803 RepID=A0A4Y2FA02_ARAVE|nr:hypothetical protein AVEN_234818-1 [Araneus ventricosus]